MSTIPIIGGPAAVADYHRRRAENLRIAEADLDAARAAVGQAGMSASPAEFASLMRHAAQRLLGAFGAYAEAGLGGRAKAVRLLREDVRRLEFRAMGLAHGGRC